MYILLQMLSREKGSVTKSVIGIELTDRKQMFPEHLNSLINI